MQRRWVRTREATPRSLRIFFRGDKPPSCGGVHVDSLIFPVSTRRQMLVFLDRDKSDRVKLLVCVCVCACVCVCVCACLRERECHCVYKYIRTRTRPCIFILIYTQTPTHPRTHKHWHSCIHITLYILPLVSLAIAAVLRRATLP